MTCKQDKKIPGGTAFVKRACIWAEVVGADAMTCIVYARCTATSILYHLREYFEIQSPILHE
jgi:hypothetical protein